MISYGKLWILLESKGMKKTDLLNVVSTPTLAKLGKNENINVSMIGKICDYLDCQPGDIMENVSEKKLQAVAEQIDMMQKVMIDALKEKGINEDEFMSMMNEAFPAYMKQMFNNENPMQNLINTAIQEIKTAQSEGIDKSES